MDIENNPIETEESSNEESLSQTISQAFERARDEQGKFTTKEPEVKAEVAPEVKPEQAAEAKEPLAIEPVQNTKQARAPDSWSPAAKSKFAELPPEIQSEVMRREEEVHKGFTKFDEERVLGKQIKDTMSPYMPLIRSQGGDEKTAIAGLLQTAYTLHTSDLPTKTRLIQQLAQQHGVDLGHNNAQPVDQTVHQLQNELQQLKQYIQSQQVNTEQQEQAQIHSTIDSFASKPENIYFHDVKPAMAALLKEGQAKDLQEAYDMACWARPDIRPLMLQSQQKQTAEQVREKANKARNAAVSVTGSPVTSTGNSSQPAATLADELRNQFAAASGRV